MLKGKIIPYNKFVKDFLTACFSVDILTYLLQTLIHNLHLRHPSHKQTIIPAKSPGEGEDLIADQDLNQALNLIDRNQA